MLIKVSLIVAIIAAIGTLVVTQLPVAEKITALNTELDTTKTSLTAAEADATKSKSELKVVREVAEKTGKQLAETTANLEVASSKATSQENRANRAETELNKTKTELTESQRDLASWKALGRPVDQIEKALGDLVKANVANEALTEEKRVISRKLTQTEARLQKYEGDKDMAPDMPAGIKGKIVAVNPEWDFVVLDIGGNQGLVERGELLVNREGKLVAKLRITAVEANRAIANVLPAWKQSSVVEGDLVMH
jgi:hypothetical protein